MVIIYLLLKEPDTITFFCRLYILFLDRELNIQKHFDIKRVMAIMRVIANVIIKLINCIKILLPKSL